MGYHSASKAFGVSADVRSSTPQRFTQAQCDALFAAILIDDEVDPQTDLPDAVRFDFAQRDLLDCFALALQLWREGFDRALLIRATDTLIRGGDLSAADRRAYKHVRAKFKHLRYAHRLYDRRGAYPLLLDKITIAMGQLQDAFRNRRRGATILYAIALRVLLARPFVARLRVEANRFAPIDSAGFRSELERDRAHLAAVLAADRVTGREFHEARKIVGRQVSFYDTLRTLQPAPDSYRMSRALSAINGLMGALHDELVVARTHDRSSYETERFALPDPIRTRLTALVARMARDATSVGQQIVNPDVR